MKVTCSIELPMCEKEETVCYLCNCIDLDAIESSSILSGASFWILLVAVHSGTAPHVTSHYVMGQDHLGSRLHGLSLQTS